MRVNNNNYYKLNDQGTKWVLSTLTPDVLSYRWIKLYNDDLSYKGIGMYPKSN
jgi:hypothetical protein